ncbi:Leucine-specific-binding protein precursor [Achromobacter spanius]|uniref:ABC transporter substrate-binding protein n=1 Tax=Achromobacter spanius TaxID=217203 RepID=UPI000C2CB6B7|nr:ABC transporter substrate-binding protein [Achromobacter spanius]AUA56150.1 amino acid ABC transporter substrate-binding protein [Achromobacter spanius]CAB3697314.1 Leu/Ile/Val-binding protein [Achromobacter spanius]SPT39091.1 Leucine-specific-binding protein precursor [Achromobacter denitrificans]VEE56302.1 Leucine-specific-binding protein precursor [Achromobacter spanius]
MYTKHFPKTMKALLLSAALMGVSAAAQADDVKIGFNSDMSATGSADFGISALAGARQAADDLNAAGGVLGKKVVIVERDDVGAPPKAIQNTNELVDNVKVNAMLGGVNSGNMLAWLHLVQQKKIPTISPVATATDITGRYAKTPPNYVFRVSMRDRDQIALLAAYAARASKSGKVAIIADTTGYGQQGAKDALEILALHQITPVANEKFGPKDTDMSSQLNKIKASGADTLIVYALADSNAHVMRSLEKINYFPTTLASWANLSSPFLRIAGPELAGKMIFTASITEDSSAQSKALYDTLMKRGGRVPTYVMAAQAYDSVKLIAAAMEQAKSTDGPAVQAALEQLAQAPGVIKTYQHPFSASNHEALSVNDFRLVRWIDGKVVTVDDEITRAIKPEDLKR